MTYTVLVPLDGSAFAEHALSPALAAARRLGGAMRLALVHEPVALPVPARPSPVLIDPLPGLPPPDPRIDRAVRQDRESYLRTVARHIGDDYGVSVTTALLDGPVPEALAAHASDVGAAFVVMTTHGHGGLSRLWLGSVAERVVREADVPVLLIRPDSGTDASRRPAIAPRDFRCLVIALDGSLHAESVIAPALDLLADGAECTLVQVVEPVMAISVAGLAPVGGAPTYDPGDQAGHIDDYLESVAADIRERGFAVHTRAVLHKRAAAGILEHAREIRADLIAMATHGRHGLRRLVLGSVPDKVLRSADGAVLLYRPPQE